MCRAVDPQGQGDQQAAGRQSQGLCQPAARPLSEPFPYLIVDAHYEKVREAGVVRSQAVLIAVGIDWDGRRQILAVEMASRESRSAWKDFLMGLRSRGLKGVEFVVSDDHAGLVAAIDEVIPEAAWQRATYISSGMRLITCRASMATIACRNSDESTTGAISPRLGPTFPPGLPNGQANIPASPAGSRRPSSRH
jgi:hypothetical protein